MKLKKLTTAANINMISFPKFSLRGLRTFCAAARYESFRIAGERLFITASAVSHQIKSLEEELGAPLFARQGRAISLTELATFEKFS